MKSSMLTTRIAGLTSVNIHSSVFFLTENNNLTLIVWTDLILLMNLIIYLNLQNIK
jgi:hypothetical protein